MQLQSNVAKIYDLTPAVAQEPEPVGTLVLDDSEFDHTAIKLDDPETLVFQQVDEFGKTHSVILSPRMVRQLLPHLTRWNAKNL